MDLGQRGTVEALSYAVNRRLPLTGGAATLSAMPWHPTAVHFPIALLTGAVAVDAAALLMRRGDWHRIAYGLLTAAALGAAVAVVTGNVDAADYRQTQLAAQIQAHEDLGTINFIWLLVMVLGRMPAMLGRPVHRYSGWVWLAAGVAGMLLTILTGARGGELVYDLGVGVSGFVP